MKKIVNVSDALAQFCGYITYWKVTGLCNHKELVAQLNSNCLSILPPPASKKQLLLRALQTLTTKLLYVRPLGHGRGYALIQEERMDTGSLKQHTIARAVFNRPNGALSVITLRNELEKDIRAAYRSMKGTLAAKDIAKWLRNVLVHLKALSLREHGGIHFVPLDSLDVFNEYIAALENVSNSSIIYRIPSMTSATTVKALATALADEVMNTTESIILKINGGAKTKALHTMEGTCEELIIKTSYYENLLEDNLPGLHTILEETLTKLAEAKLTMVK
jgi:hypothetical protein